MSSRLSCTYLERLDDHLSWLAPAPTISTSRPWPKSTPATTVRDYRRHLLAERKASPATAKLALVAIDSFYAWLGLGAPDVARFAVGRRLV